MALLFAMLACSPAESSGPAAAAADKAEVPRPPDESPPKVEPAVVRAVDVPPIPAKSLKDWRTFATRQWWLAGEEVPCDGKLEARPIMSGVTGTMGEGLTCTKEGEPGLAWFRRGQDACPTGSKLTGAPPPILDSLMCMRPDGTAHGPFTFWVGNDLDRTGGTKDGQTHGLNVALFPDGTLREVATFVDGKEEGLSLLFFKDGGRAAQMSYVAGRLQGTATGWHSSGRLAQQSNYVDGKLDGTMTAWASDDDRVCGQSVLAAGTGTFTQYWGDCSVFRRGEMVDGEQRGTWEQYDRDGKPVPPIRD